MKCCEQGILSQKLSKLGFRNLVSLFGKKSRIGLLHWYWWILFWVSISNDANVRRYPIEGQYSPISVQWHFSYITMILFSRFHSYSVFLLHLTLQTALYVTVQNWYQKVISFLHLCSINMILFLHCYCFAANLVVKINYLSKNQLCCSTCDFQTLREIVTMFWFSMTSYFMTSSENDVSNFDVIQRQHSTMVITWDFVNGRQTSITDLKKKKKRAILILPAGTEKYRHHCSLAVVVHF